MKLNFRQFALVLADIVIISFSAIISDILLPILGILTNKSFDMGYSELFIFILFYDVLCFLTLWLFGAYNTLWRYSKFKDYLCCILGMFLGTFLFSLVSTLFEANNLFISTRFIATTFFISLIGICLFRFLFRNTFLTIRKAEQKKHKKRIMIIGAGQACMLILKEIKNGVYDGNNPAGMYNPVCLIDDDPNKLHTKIDGVDVVGTTSDIPTICKQYDIDIIIYAIPSCPENERKRILDICSGTSCSVKIIPYLSQLIFNDNNTVNILSQVKELKVEDLLGREPITFDKNDIVNLIKDKVCMITGGGGSIGSELTRQISKYSPKQVIIVDIYENNAYEIQQELIMEYGDELNLVTLIASVRDYTKMTAIFKKYKPDIVFHAAAHKHVPLMETSPEEAVKNNVIGTFNVMSLSEYFGVKKFIMISTDKAVNPTNVMGATKRCCEMIAQYMSQTGSKTEFVTTRFGNVLGSNGSVIPLFRRQIESGKPVTVTHPDIIRYFMTIPEAVSLVLQAGAMAHGGEIFVLDMGSPVKIVTLAENLIRMYGKIPYKDVEIKFTGLRPGEKLFEELLMGEEGLKSTENKKIFIGNQIKLDEKEFIDSLQALKQSANENNSEKTVELLSKMVPTFNHKS